MPKRGDKFCLDINREYHNARLNELRDNGVILTYDEPYDVPNDSRDYYTCVYNGKTEVLVLEPYEVQEVQTAFIPVEPEAGPGGMKYDGGKPRMALLLDGCPNALEAVASVLTFGAQKYAAHSWQTVPEGEERYKSALLRHLTAVGKGEELDPESGLHHLAHAACNALFILELALRKTK
ncbi:putative phosphodiestherase [Escherichia phage forsur]|nr:putative phosphodiestherase [Escherichia phage forsur]